MSQHRKSKSAKSAADASLNSTSDDPAGLRLRVEPGSYGVSRLGPKTRVPRWVYSGGFFTVTRTDDELSILGLEDHVPDGVQCERGWSLIKVLGTLDFSLIGVLASMAQPLAEARIGLLTVSTYDTDYLLVRTSKLEDARAALESAGHRFEDPGEDSGDEDSEESHVSAEDRPAAKAARKAVGKAAARKKTPAQKKAAASKKAAKATGRASEAKTGRDDDAKPRRRSRGSRRRGGAHQAPRRGGSLYIGEEWEHVETIELDDADDVRAEPRQDREPEPATKRSRKRTRSAAKRRRAEDVETVAEPSTEAVEHEAASVDRAPSAEAYEVQPARRSRTRRSSRRRRAGGSDSEPAPGSESAPKDVGTPAPEAISADSASPEAEDEAPAKPRIRRTRRSRRRATQDVGTEDAGTEDVDTRDRALDQAQPEPESGPLLPELGDDPPTAVDTDELPADERDPFEDDGDNAEGLYTGAIPQNPVETTEDDFASLGLSERMVQTLGEIGFTHPTPIQAAALPMALEGSDIIGLAETGSGKTGAFGLPLAERLHHGRGVRGLILCPTREIALQTKAFLDIFGRDHELETAVIIGGVKFDPQIRALRRHPDIIVATPGRLADHMRRGNVRLDKLEELVLDEADHMLDLGFLPQIQEIVSRVPRERRTMMFSATMPPTIERLAQRFLRDPYIVDLRPVSRVASGIEHRLYLVESGHERQCLISLLEEVDDTTLVFARRKLDTEFLARQLQLAGLPAERIHSDRSQAQRVAALRGFREGKKRILVATDVAARGIDVPHLGHVINFGMPDTVEDYVHRAGRTARGKAVGIVSSIGTWQDKPMVKEIERTIGQAIARKEVDGVKAYRELKPRRGGRRRRLL